MLYFSEYIEEVYMKLMCVLLLCIGSLQLLAYDESDIQRILIENDRLTLLEEYKDSEEMIRLKCEHIDYINSFRKKYRVQPVKMDVLASRVANMHAQRSVEGNYFGHWDLEGNTPFLRYGLNGGKDHVSENVFAKFGGLTYTKNYPRDKVIQMTEGSYKGKFDVIMREGVDGFMAEGPGGGHHDTLVHEYHNYVGIGIAAIAEYGDTKSEFRVVYCEEYLDRYIEFDDFAVSAATDEKVAITGTIIPKDWGLYAVLVYYHPFPKKMTPDQIKSRHSYPDYTDVKHDDKWPWELVFDAKNQTFSYEFSASKKGYYYIQLFLKEDISSIPYNGGSASTQGLCNASGIIITVK